ncbi:MAG: DUF2157 domain-containing protein [Planctomycetota bacterium]|jgi:uncharacterized membrane protein
MDQPEPVTPQAVERPATSATLLALFHAGLLPRAALEAAMQATGVQRSWWRWSNLLLLCLGGGLILAGILFFIAYNWMEMDKFVKLGGLQVLILACAVAAWRRGLARLDGRALLLAACVLVGVFLAAFGQVYQTGADAYELFRAWALLIVFWVAASRAPVHWLLLLLVTDLAIGLYVEQVLVYRWERSYGAWLVLALTQAVTLAGFEVARERGYFWLQQAWPRRVLVPVILFFLAAPASPIIFEDYYDKPWAWLVLLSLVAAILGGYRYYRYIGRDLFALTCIGFATAWVVFMYAAKLIDLNDDNCMVFGFLGALVIGMLGYLVWWVRTLNVAMQREEEEARG